MSEDEILVLVVCGGVSIWTWWSWYVGSARVHRLLRRRSPLWLIFMAPVVAGGILAAVLRLWSSHDVRDSVTYLSFYFLMGAGWTGLAAQAFPLLALSVRDDAIERGNSAAAWASTGAVVAVTMCFAGGNIGDGPGWWVVVFCAMLSTGGLFLLWAITARVGGAMEAIVVDRDVSAGLRFAGFLVACGLVLGRSVAGDWTTWAAAVNDFLRISWPLVPLALACSAVDRALKPTPATPSPSVEIYGLALGSIYVAAAAFYIHWLGPW